MLRPAWFWVSINRRKWTNTWTFIYTESFQITSWGWVMINRQRFVCFSGNSNNKLDAAIASINRVLMCKIFCSVERKWEACVWILFVWMGLCFIQKELLYLFISFLFFYIYSNYYYYYLVLYISVFQFYLSLESVFKGCDLICWPCS